MTNTRKRVHADGTLTKHVVRKWNKTRTAYQLNAYVMPQRARKISWREQFRKAHNVELRELKKLRTLRRLDAARLVEVQ